MPPCAPHHGVISAALSPHFHLAGAHLPGWSSSFRLNRYDRYASASIGSHGTSSGACALPTIPRASCCISARYGVNGMSSAPGSSPGARRTGRALGGLLAGVLIVPSLHGGAHSRVVEQRDQSWHPAREIAEGDLAPARQVDNRAEVRTQAHRYTD